TDLLQMEDTYLSDDDLGRLLGSADIAFLPYDSTDQVSSGVLVEALGAGLPVVATAFPHAVEMLEGGAGIVVPHRDPLAMAEAISKLLTDPEALDAARRRAEAVGETLHWPVIAERCEAIAASARRSSLIRTGPADRHRGESGPRAGARAALIDWSRLTRRGSGLLAIARKMHPHEGPGIRRMRARSRQA